MRKPRTHGFTLAEILISIGIIVLLIGLLLPAVMKANKNAMRVRIQGDFQTITTALEAYKQDFGDIPRLPTYPTGVVAPCFAGNPVANTGAAILGKALLGPYGDGLLPNGSPDPSDPPTYQAAAPYHAGDCVQDAGGKLWVAVLDSVGVPPTDTDKHWAYFTATDNSDGPGFKIRAGAAKVWGPYIQSGKMKNQGAALLDASGSPILYFPGHLGSIDVTKDSGGSNPDQMEPYCSLNPTSTPGPAVSLYDASDNLELFRQGSEPDVAALGRIRSMLGDWNCNGFIDMIASAPETTETAVRQPYLLWSAGPDGIFGPATPTTYAMPIAALTASKDVMQLKKYVDQSDDVTNFR